MKAPKLGVAKVLGIEICRDVGGAIRTPTEEATLATPLTTAKMTEVEVITLVGEDTAVVAEDEATTGIVIEIVIDIEVPMEVPAKTNPQNEMKSLKICTSEWKTSRRMRTNIGGN